MSNLRLFVGLEDAATELQEGRFSDDHQVFLAARKLADTFFIHYIPLIDGAIRDMLLAGKPYIVTLLQNAAKICNTDLACRENIEDLIFEIEHPESFRNKLKLISRAK